MKKSFTVFFLNFLKKNNKKDLPLYLKPLFFLLFVLSLPFELFVFLKNKIPTKNAYHPEKGKVISIGNITLGGTGKTPFTLFLAKELAKKGDCGIFLRGYKGEIEKKGTSEKMLRKDPLYFGDEASLYFEELKKAPIFVGKNRVTSLKLSEQENLSFLLLDDAFQNKKIEKDLSIVLLDAEHPLGYGFFPPRGLLRDEPSSLEKADFLVFHSGTKKVLPLPSSPFFTTLLEKKPHAQTGISVDGIFNLSGEKQSLQGPLALFSAIAKPDKFLQTVKEEGFEVVNTYFLSDHASFDLPSLSQFALESKEKGATFLLCTSKDKVKLESLPSLPLPLFFLKTSLVFFSGEEKLHFFL